LVGWLVGSKLVPTLRHTFLAGNVGGGTPADVSGNSASLKLFQNFLPLISSQPLNS
jgi:hypothetical protein